MAKKKEGISELSSYQRQQKKGEVKSLSFTAAEQIVWQNKSPSWRNNGGRIFSSLTILGAIFVRVHRRGRLLF
jgi:hypothetical protein